MSFHLAFFSEKNIVKSDGYDAGATTQFALPLFIDAEYINYNSRFSDKRAKECYEKQ